MHQSGWFLFQNSFLSHFFNDFTKKTVAEQRTLYFYSILFFFFFLNDFMEKVTGKLFVCSVGFYFTFNDFRKEQWKKKKVISVFTLTLIQFFKKTAVGKKKTESFLLSILTISQVKSNDKKKSAFDDFVTFSQRKVRFFCRPPSSSCINQICMGRNTLRNLYNVEF